MVATQYTFLRERGRETELAGQKGEEQKEWYMYTRHKVPIAGLCTNHKQPVQGRVFWPATSRNHYSLCVLISVIFGAYLPLLFKN